MNIKHLRFASSYVSIAITLALLISIAAPATVYGKSKYIREEDQKLKAIKYYSSVEAIPGNSGDPTIRPQSYDGASGAGMTLN